jgi:hypothetical protein
MATNNAVNANSTTPLPIADGGTGVNAVTTSPTASAFAGWDTNNNLSANNHINSYTTTATAASTTVLTVSSTYQQYFTGITTQTVTMPVANTCVLGQSWLIVNNSTGVVTVQSSGGNTITAMASGTQAIVTCILTSGTSAASWNSDYSSSVAGVSSIAGTSNQVIASASTGAVTLSLPQSIATSSAVQFASVQFSGNNGLLDSNGNEILKLNPLSSAINFVRVSNAATGQFPALAAIGGDTNTTLFLQGSGTGGASIQGTTAGGNATVGYVGETISSQILQASPTSFSNNTPANLTSINLSAGDWDVYGNIHFSGTTAQVGLAGLNTTPNTLPDKSLYNDIAGLSTATDLGLCAPMQRFNVSTTTTVYLVGVVVGTGTLVGSGLLLARRVR